MILLDAEIRSILHFVLYDRFIYARNQLFVFININQIYNKNEL